MGVGEALRILSPLRRAEKHWRKEVGEEWKMRKSRQMKQTVEA